jgi:hypothetical protein
VEEFYIWRKSSLLSPAKYTDICKADRAVTSKNDFAQRGAHVLSLAQLQRHPLGLADNGPHILSLMAAMVRSKMASWGIVDKAFALYCDGTGLKISSCPTLVSQDVPFSANSSAASE